MLILRQDLPTERDRRARLSRFRVARHNLGNALGKAIAAFRGCLKEPTFEREPTSRAMAMANLDVERRKLVAALEADPAA